MNEKTQPTNEIEVGTQFVFNAEPSAPNVVLQGISRVAEAAKLEARMIIFDAFHGTNYRQIRHDLVAQKKREQFEASIGLVAVGKK
jgi:hypothetical protein